MVSINIHFHLSISVSRSLMNPYRNKFHWIPSLKILSELTLRTYAYSAGFTFISFYVFISKYLSLNTNIYIYIYIFLPFNWLILSLNSISFILLISIYKYWKDKLLLLAVVSQYLYIQHITETVKSRSRETCHNKKCLETGYFKIILKPNYIFYLHKCFPSRKTCGI